METISFLVIGTTLPRAQYLDSNRFTYITSVADTLQRIP